MNNKHLEYGKKIMDAILKELDPNNENGIDLDDLNPKENDYASENIDALMYAILCIAPTMVFNKFMTKQRTILEVNHEANKLCLENMIINKKGKRESPSPQSMEKVNDQLDKMLKELKINLPPKQDQ